MERRKHTEDVVKVIPSLVRFMNMTIGGFIVVGSIGIAVVGGFIWYVNQTHDRTMAAVEAQALKQKNHEDKYSKKFERTSREISGLANKVSGLTTQLDTYTKANQELLEKLVDKALEEG